MAIRLFSKKPYLKKQREKKLIQQNKRNWQKEQKERNRWKQDNKFDDSTYLRKWLKRKDLAKKDIEELLLASLGYEDGAQAASEMMSKGLNIHELLLDREALEDLTYNIFMVKLADITCSEKGANLRQEDRRRVMKLIIGQLFPQPAPMQPTSLSDRKAEALLERVKEIKRQG